VNGYAWYVPKEKGIVNIGLGGYARELKASGKTLHDLFHSFKKFLIRKRLLDEAHAGRLRARGHPYYTIAGKPQEIKRRNCFLIGDSAGLATQDLGEGIAPAVESGLLAAKEILGLDEYRADKIAPYSISNRLVRSVIGNRLPHPLE
jgi:flavin-dependent dehydrogenase